MASIFTIGENKIRPGVYFRYENYRTTLSPGEGGCAVVLRSDWGPLGRAVILKRQGDISDMYGDGGTNGTTSVAYEQFKGGASTVCAVRLGSGGTAGTYQIEDSEETVVIQLTLNYPGSRAFSLTLRQSLTYTGTGELLFLEGTTILESIRFDTSTNWVNALLDAVAARGNSYFTLTKIADTTTPMAEVTQVQITPGTNPSSYTVTDYLAAFSVLEAQRWEVLSIDTSDITIQAAMRDFLSNAFEGGKLVIGVVGEPVSIPFETRLGNASNFNSKQIVYVGGGFTDSLGTVYDGWLAAARIAGLIAATPSNRSLTHLPVSGAIGLAEPLTNRQYEQSILGGMLTFSLSAGGIVWVESGINTLVNPDEDDDAGWKKIKRVRVRFELIRRLTGSTELLIGQINNDQDGRMNVVQEGNTVCNAMVAEGKLMPGARCEIDSDNPPEGDSAWFIVYADDMDALEKAYFTFRFRFSPAS